MTRTLVPVLFLSLLAGGCKKEESSALTGLAKGDAGSAATTATASKDTGQTEEAAPEAREEPVATPARESLELLSKKGAPEVRSLRSERSNMYTLFSTVEKEEADEVNAIIKDVQALSWSDDPEALRAAPARLAGLATRALDAAKKLHELGEKQEMAEVQAMMKENEERVAQKKRPKHTEVKIDKLQRKASYHIKIGRYLGLLARSLLDEARVYATFGSLAMRQELRDLFTPMKGRELPFEQTSLAVQRLLYALNVEGVEQPSDD